MWEEERGKQIGEVDRGRQRMEVESKCVKVWEGDRGRHRGGNRKCVFESVGGRQRNTYSGIESIYVRVLEGERGRQTGEVESKCVSVTPQVFVNVYTIIIFLFISIDKSIIRTR
jgi:hypothetical protein